MIAWGYEIIEFGEHEAEKLISLDIIACQMAEGRAAGQVPEGREASAGRADHPGGCGGV